MLRQEAAPDQAATPYIAKVVTMMGPRGEIRCESHAPWCPIEIQRSMYPAQEAIIFGKTGKGAIPACRCAFEPPYTVEA